MGVFSKQTNVWRKRSIACLSGIRMGGGGEVTLDAVVSVSLALSDFVAFSLSSSFSHSLLTSQCIALSLSVDVYVLHMLV